MSERNLSNAAERLLEVAMRLFAEKGYERTAVGEIQEGAGLTFGSGALYKHFPSKEAVLTEGIERFIESARNERRMLGSLEDMPASEAMTVIAKSAMASFDRDSDALRIAWRDLEAFPELQRKVSAERIRATFDDFSAWLAHEATAGKMQVHDSQAVAAVGLSSLAFFQLLKHLMHDTPGGLDEDHFVEAWAHIFVSALT
jgi:AcrR family transcriptional regulator